MPHYIYNTALLIQANSADKLAGEVALVVIFVLVFVFVIWASISNARESEKTRKKIQQIKSSLNERNKMWNNFKETLSMITEPNCKCNLPIYRIFEVYEDGSIEYRCLTCSKKGRHSGLRLKQSLEAQDATETEVHNIFEDIRSTQWHINKINNETFGEFDNSLTSWEIPKSRGPWYRGIRFRPKKETEQELGKRRRSISTKTKQTVWERDMGKCVRCGKETDLEYDHIIPFSKGGSNGPNNIQLLCRECNSKKRAKIQ